MKSTLPFLTALMLTGLPFSSYAVNAKSGLLNVRQPDGSRIEMYLEGDENSHVAKSIDGRVLISDRDGFYVYASAEDSNILLQERTRPKRLPGLMPTGYPTKGEQKALVILVEFADNEFSVTDPQDFFYRMLNEEGFSDGGATGSARDYFIENSSGLFIPHFDVYGPVKLPQDMRYYGANDRWGNDSNPQQMVIQACEALDKEIDFSEYDADGNGIIDNVFVYYAGYGEADGGGANTIWPHSSQLSLVYNTKYMFDGVQLDRYACTNELQNFLKPGEPDGIGTFCHEFGHVLGIPDLYATMAINLTTPGIWDIMDNGSYNNGCMTPPYLSAYERAALGWLEPHNLQMSDYVLYPLGESNQAYIYKGTDNEFFLFENRQQQGFDEYLPGHGMLIWHIDYNRSAWDNNMVNNNIWHMYIDLVEADNEPGLGSFAGDSFPGTKNVTVFSKHTTPSFSFWDKTIDVPLALWHIRESDEGLVSFSVVPLSFADNNIDEEDEEEENAVLYIEEGSSFEISGNRISNQSGILEIYDINGIKISELSDNSSTTLSPGLYIGLKGGRHSKFLISR